MKIRELFAKRLLEKDELSLDADTTKDELSAEEPAEDTPPEEEKPVEEPKKEDEPDEPDTIDSLFEANTDKVKEYHPIKTWDAKKLVTDTVIIANGKRTKGKAGDYVIRNHDNIKEFRLATEEEYGAQYTQIRPSDDPDAEGFVMVKESSKVKAFKYEGDDVTVKNGKDEEVEVTDGVYVVKYVNQKDSGWTVDAGEFEKVYKVNKS